MKKLETSRLIVSVASMLITVSIGVLGILGNIAKYDNQMLWVGVGIAIAIGVMHVLKVFKEEKNLEIKTILTVLEYVLINVGLGMRLGVWYYLPVVALHMLSIVIQLNKLKDMNKVGVEANGIEK